MLNRRRREALGIDPGLVDRALYQPPGILLVVDRELARVTEPRSLGSEQPRASAVKRGDEHRVYRSAEQQPDAIAHLLRRLVGEGDRQDLALARGPRSD